MFRSKLSQSKATIEQLDNYSKEVYKNLAVVSIPLEAVLCRDIVYNAINPNIKFPDYRCECPFNDDEMNTIKLAE